MTLYSEFCKNQGCCKGSLMENTTNYVLFPTKNRYNLKQNPLSVACHKVPSPSSERGEMKYRKIYIPQTVSIKWCELCVTEVYCVRKC
ncbi:unnamed protein product [Ixodes persulcatus]